MPDLEDARTKIRQLRHLGKSEDEIRDALRADGFSDEDIDHLLATADVNTSGLRGDVPPEVADLGFCFGALGLTWIWGLANRVWIALLCPIIFIFGGYLAAFLSTDAALIGPVVSLALALWLGVNGHRLAWKKRHFASLDAYRGAMRVWNIVGIVVFVLKMVLSILIAGLAMSYFGSAGK